MEIKYEDFCLKPLTIIEKISKFLELDYEKERAEEMRLEIKPSFGKYNNFNIKELRELNEIIKENMEKLGYGMEE